MSRVLLSVLFSIQGIIQNTTCSVWFRIQRIIKKCPGYYSASGSGFRLLLKNVQGINQRLVQYSGYYSKYDLQRLVQDSAYYSKMSRVLFSGSGSGFSVLFKCPGYYSAYGSVYSVLLKKCPGYYSESGSRFSVFKRNVQGIIQRVVQ